ncbi:MAG TPA: penicillin-binding protein [Anaerolineaceae bacterium]|nr:penicillin-binding protein [Anaerolineaceae bacterium]
MRPLSLYLLLKRRQQHKDRARRSLGRRTGQFGLAVGALMAVLAVVFLLVGGLIYADLVHDLPSLAQLPALFNYPRGSFYQPTRLFDRSGMQVLFTLENQGAPRDYLSINPAMTRHYPPQFVQVVLAVAQPDFWQSPGLDWGQLTTAEPRTIAERLVSDWLLWQEMPGLRRSLRMRLLAGQVVSSFGREQVLEWYLNSAYFGHLAYGAESAAQLYFGKSAQNLTLSESITLAAVLQAPALNPLDAPAAAAQRQQELLEQLFAKGTVTLEEYLQVRDAPLNFATAPAEVDSPARAYSQLVLDQLFRRYGRDRVERGGLEVITTLDMDLQEQLSCSTQAQLARMQAEAAVTENCPAALRLPALAPGLPPYPASLTASAVVLDPRRGEVLAYLGDTTRSGESRLAQSRPPGSILTPFVILAGFARTSSPSSLVWDTPASMPEALQGFQNPDGKYHGPVRLRIAVGNDYLVPLAQMLDQISPATVWKLAELLGLGGLAENSQPGALLFAGGEVSLLQLAQAYSPFATQGLRAGWRSPSSGNLEAVLVLSVSDSNGQTWIPAAEPEVQAVLSPQLAYLVHHVLSDVTARWESLGLANPLELGRPAGAKLGQTADGHQVWVVGYTPQLLVVTSFSLPEDAGNLRLNLKAGAGVWHAMMQYALQDMPPEDWNTPPDILTLEVCDPSGLLPTVDCARVVREIFLTANQPVSYDTLYRTVEINRETGRLATVFTPLSLIEQRVFLIVPPEAQAWARSAGLPLPPTEYDLIQPPELLADVKMDAPLSFSYVNGKVLIRGTAAGDNFKSYRIQAGQGLNPRTWIQIGTEQTLPVLDGMLAEWDTSGQEGLFAIRLLVLREDNQVDMAVVQVTLDNTAPQAQISYPLPQSSIQAVDGRVVLQAEVSDQIGVRRVEWYLDDRLLAEQTQAPFVYSWAAQPGTHRLVVKAYDLAGNFTASLPVSFTIVP